ncbi:MAG: N-acetylglucosamine-6-phosphate deacetylase [bacterium]|nr:N-acetylglucosamine-6-phosphate deacetylase [bacterium]
MSTICLSNGNIFTGITTLAQGAVIITDGQIDDVVSQERFKKKTLPPNAVVIDVEGAHIAPGFMDTHIHGLHGFGTSDASPESILQMSKALLEYGVTSFCPTIYPQADEDHLQCIQAGVQAMGHEQGAEILGLHLEGPFISPAQAGVQKVQYFKAVDLDLMKKFCQIAGDRISMMTVAPELKNMRDLALYCTKRGIILSAGHSDAAYENMLEGMQAGILHATHFFNAMRRLHHRDPGVVGAILIHRDVTCEIIADGIHVHPAILQLLMREKPINNIVLVTDALRPTGQTEGILMANREEVYLDGVFRRKSDDVMAGSALTMIRGVQNLAQWGTSLEDALRMAACNPARVLGLQHQKGFLLPGQDANVVVFNNHFDIQMTMVKGIARKVATGTPLENIPEPFRYA